MSIEKKPIESLRLTDEAKRKLRFYSKSLTVGKEIDYRTPFYAVDNRVVAPVDSGARISGIDSLKALSRASITQAFIPHILEGVKEYPTITQFEKEFVKYVSSSKSIELP